MASLFAVACGPSEPGARDPAQEPVPVVAEPSQPSAAQDEAPTTPLAQTSPDVTSTGPANAIDKAPSPPPYTLHQHDVIEALHPIEDPSGHALDHVFEALTQIDRSETPAESLVRVIHWGDSSIGRDGFPDQIRARFWRRFGDGGPGFLMPESFTGFYQPKSAVLDGNEKWGHCYIAYGCRPNGRYGLGGVIFTSAGGAHTDFRTTYARSKRPWGRSWAHAELWYVATPKGGQLSVQVDDDEPVRLDTRLDASRADPSSEGDAAASPKAAVAWQDRWWATELEPGAHQLSLRARGFGRARVYGVVLEAEGPGVVWDAIPMSGAFTKRLLFWDAEHIRRQIEHRRPDLIVFQYGGNDLKRIVTGTDAAEFRAELDEVLPRLRAGRPQASCLVIGISHHGRSGHFDVDPAHVETIVRVQREAAFAHGCAFFDSFAAMGGRGSLKTWRRRGLLWGDLAHLSPRGHAEMAKILWSAFSSRYVAYRRRGSRAQ